MLRKKSKGGSFSAYGFISVLLRYIAKHKKCMSVTITVSTFKIVTDLYYSFDSVGDSSFYNFL